MVNLVVLYDLIVLSLYHTCSVSSLFHICVSMLNCSYCSARAQAPHLLFLYVYNWCAL